MVMVIAFVVVVVIVAKRVGCRASWRALSGIYDRLAKGLVFIVDVLSAPAEPQFIFRTFLRH